MHGFKGKIVNFGKHIINSVDDVEEREKQWLNVPEHLTGNHENCNHEKTIKKPGRPRENIKVKSSDEFSVWKKGIEYPKAKEALQDFCNKTAKFIKSCEKKTSTQANESQNSMIAREADKNISYGPSYEARALVAVGKRNDPEHFVLDVLEKTGIVNKLSEENESKIKNRWKQKSEKNEIRNQNMKETKSH